MAPPSGIGVIDTMIGFPDKDFAVYDFIRNQLKDGESTDFEFPVEYMFKNVPKELYGSDADPIEVTLGEMDRFGIEYGLIGCEGEQSQRALTEHPDRFIPQANVSVVDLTVRLEKETSYEEIKAVVKQHADSDMKNILGYTEEGVVSQDFVGDIRTSVFDAGAGMELNPQFFKIISWYDNECGYSNKLIDLAKHINQL